VKSGGLGQVSGEVRLEGFVNSLAGSSPNFSFSVNGQSITTNANTAYDSGTPANLANSRVEVEGQISSGVLLATKVKFEEKNNDVRITAQVTVKSATVTNLTVFGAPGVSVTTDTSTIFQDNSSQQLRVFGFADVQVNDWLQIEAAKDSANSVAATKVVRINAPLNNVAILQGPVDIRTVLPNIFILGVKGVTQPVTTFQDANGNPLIQTTFFSQMTATANSIVKMSGQFDGLQIPSVDAAQLEN
jgi:predicted secreted protein